MPNGRGGGVCGAGVRSVRPGRTARTSAGPPRARGVATGRSVLGQARDSAERGLEPCDLLGRERRSHRADRKEAREVLTGE